MKKTRTANLHHLYHEPLPENLKLTPKVEVDNVHQRQTTDVYEHALTITAWQQIYDQLHPGKFHGEFTEILLDDIQVFREYTGLALRQSCLVWPNSFWFGIPATRGQQGFIGSRCLGSAEIATRPGGTEFELSAPDDYDPGRGAFLKMSSPGRLTIITRIGYYICCVASRRWK